MIRYLVVNIRPNKVISPSFEVWHIADNIIEAEQIREIWLSHKQITLDPDNFQVIQYNDT